MAGQDPWLQWHRRLTQDGERWEAYVDGERFGGLDQSAYLEARRLAICQVTSGCDRDQVIELVYECALAGRCASHATEAIALDPELTGQLRPIEALAARIAEHLRSGQVDALLPPK